MSGPAHAPYRILNYNDELSWVLRAEKLGSGSFANVYKGERKDNPKEVVAIKVIKKDKLKVEVAERGKRLSQISKKNKLIQNLNHEIRFLKETRHPYIIRLFDTQQTKNRIYLVFEFCECDLASYITSRKRLSEAQAKIILKQLASGLKYMQSKNLIHRDLKPSNILLSSVVPPNTPASDVALFPYCTKIADFGFMRTLNPDKLAKTMCGTPKFMAPEIICGKSYSNKVDLWSVGVILFEMVTGVNPFKGLNVRELHKANAQKQKHEMNEEIDNIIAKERHHFSSRCFDLVSGLLKVDPDERLDWEDFFSHPFLADDSTIIHSSMLSQLSSIDSLPADSSSGGDSSDSCSDPAQLQQQTQLQSQPAPFSSSQAAGISNINSLGSNNILAHAINNNNNNNNNNSTTANNNPSRPTTPVADADTDDFIIITDDEIVWSVLDGVLSSETQRFECKIDEVGKYELLISNVNYINLYANSISVNVRLSKSSNANANNANRNGTTTDVVCFNNEHIYANSSFCTEFEVLHPRQPCTLQIELSSRFFSIFTNYFEIVVSKIAK